MYIFPGRNRVETISSVSWGHLAHWQSVGGKYLPRASQVSASQTIEANKPGKQKNRLQTWISKGGVRIGSHRMDCDRHSFPEELQGVNLCGNTLENTQKFRSPTPHLNR